MMEYSVQDQEAARLAALRRYEILDTLSEQVFDDIVRLASRLCDMPISMVSLVDEARQWFKARIGLEIAETPREYSFCAHAIEQRDVFVVPDATRDPRFADNPLVTGEPNIRFYAGAPLITSDGYALGTLCVIDREPRQLSSDQREILSALSGMVAAQMELRRSNAVQRELLAARAEVEAALTQSEQRFRSLYEFDPNVILWLDFQGQLVDANPATCVLTGYRKKELDQIGDALFFGAEDRVLTAGVVRKTMQGEAHYFEIHLRHKTGYAIPVTGWTIPIIVGDDVVGVYALARDITEQKQADAAMHRVQEELEARVRARTAELVSVADALRAEMAERQSLEVERERLLVEALDRADRCALTGLWNHRAFHNKLAAEAKLALRSGTSLAITIVDLNNFKFFNDTYGYAAGDDVLRRVARVLQDCCRPTDTLARFGGDEFAFLIPHTNSTEAQAFVDRLRHCLDGIGYHPPGSEMPVPLSVSVGVAIYPDEGEARMDVFNLADARLKRAKSGGETGEAAEKLRTCTAHSVEGFTMLDALVTSVDNKDRYTRQHSEDVMTYCEQFAQELCLDKQAQEQIQLAALLHDVGKVGVPDHILRKPGKLTEEEFAAVKLHPAMGAVIVGAVAGLEHTLPAVRHHHERWDGTGYPSGLRGEAIPLAARIMAVADAFSAMTTDRPYRKGMARSKAFALLAEGAGTQWDPDCVDALLRLQTRRISPVDLINA